MGSCQTHVQPRRICFKLTLCHSSGLCSPKWSCRLCCSEDNWALCLLLVGLLVAVVFPTTPPELSSAVAESVVSASQERTASLERGARAADGAVSCKDKVSLTLLLGATEATPLANGEGSAWAVRTFSVPAPAEAGAGEAGAGEAETAAVEGASAPFAEDSVTTLRHTGQVLCCISTATKMRMTKYFSNTSPS